MISFSKYHGLGNDFILVNYRDVKGYDLSKLALKLCDRHRGIGADGLIAVKENPLEMIYYNSDGSRAKMCGNGIRCFANYVYDKNIERSNYYTIKTLAGDLAMNVKSTSPFICEVDMGVPSYKTSDIPMNIEQEEFIREDIEVDGTIYRVTSLLMGATHSVIMTEQLDDEEITLVGKALNNHKLYPNGTNVNFFELINETEIHMKTFERGAGLTLACGTGACAVVAANQHINQLMDQVHVYLPLGKLIITKKDNHIFMEGPAEKSFEGIIRGDELE